MLGWHNWEWGDKAKGKIKERVEDDHQDMKTSVEWQGEKEAHKFKIFLYFRECTKPDWVPNFQKKKGGKEKLSGFIA